MNKVKIGVWGLGIVGKSVVKYLAQKDNQLELIHEIQVTDKREPNQEEQELLNKYDIDFINYADLEKFLNNNSKIVASPGIDLRNYNNYKDKFISELDLFYTEWHKTPDRQIIAITGTAGKTSVTHLLDSIFKSYNKSIATGGNIGTAMLDLLENRSAEAALLELSSFQLEQAKEFVSDLAIITNIYPNHLDRHNSFEDYMHAKLSLIFNQSKNQKALIPWELKDKVLNLDKQINFFTIQDITQEDLKNLGQNIIYTLKNNFIVKLSDKTETTLININLLPDISYKINWLIITATLDILGLDLNKLTQIKDINIPEDRLELVDTINNIEFYNDSKSTLGESTLAAVDKFKNKNIYLFLGGVSKGVDRTEFIYKLKNKIKSAICFGQEAKDLADKCKKAQIEAYSFDNLPDAFNKCLSITKPGDIVLFSPSGASFDLFKNYHERGQAFKKLVTEAKIKHKINKFFTL